MTDECNDLNRLQRETVPQLAVETAPLQNRSAPQVIWQAITLALVCVLLGMVIAVVLALHGRIL